MRSASTGQIRPLLVSGSPRSGTTWVGRMLAESGSYNYLYEPFNPGAGVGRDICNARFTRFFTYICPDNESRYLSAMGDMMNGRYLLRRGLASSRSLADVKRVFKTRRELENHRRTGVKPLIKDPIALMSLDWIASRFDVDVIVMIRHPAAFVSSMRRMDWSFAPGNWALSQPELMRDFLEPFRADLETMDANGADIIERTSLAWTLMNYVVLKYRERHRNWHFVKHEEISSDPVAGFADLYGKLGLVFDDEVRATIESYSNASNPKQAEGNLNTIKLDSKANIKGWRKRLTDEEVSRIRRRVEPVSGKFYADDEW